MEPRFYGVHLERLAAGPQDNLCNQKTNKMIRKLKSGQYRIYSRKIDPKTKRRRNLGTFDSLDAARQHEKAIQYFKHH